MRLTIFAPAPKLTANRADRTLSGTLLPYGEVGVTNLGKIRASRGALSVAPGVLPINVEHDPKQPIGTFASLDDTETRLNAAFNVLATRAGDDALAEAEAGLRCGLSIEVDNAIVKGGQLVSGLITGAALVSTPAFTSARLAASALSDVPDTTGPATEDQGAGAAEVTIDGQSVPATNVAITTAAPTETPKESSMTAARVQTPALAAPTKTSPDTGKLFATLAAAFAAGETFTSASKLLAALSDIVPANTLAMDQPQYVGQLWDGIDYVRRFIPLFKHADLTAQTVNGWRWKDGKRPTVDLYTGNKSDIPSNAIDTEAATGVLQRIAGGHDIDRIYRDFSNTEFWSAYFAAMANSYAKTSDRWVRDQVKAIPTVANGGRVHLLNAAMPSGVPAALAMVVKGALKMLNTEDLEVMPTFALITASYWEQLMYVPQDDVLAYLSASLSLKEGQVSDFKLVPVPDDALTVGTWVGKVLVGHESAVTVRELPGAPIRVEAEAIAKGGVDEALFGYVHTMTENAKALVAFDAPTAA